MPRDYAEGYWEDLLKNASRFQGRRVRITLLEKPEKRNANQRTKPVDEKTARFIKDFAGSWEGDDLDSCLESVYQTRTDEKW